jgi:TRAP-type C4-dicarboxylate transport system permease small subunit
MNKFVAKLDYLIEKLLMLLILAIVLIVTWQVLSRYLLQAPSSVSEEAARFLLIWISLIGAVYCYRTKAHLGLDIITNKLAIKQQKIAAIFSHVMVFLFSALVLVIGGIRLVILAFQPIQRSPALDVPMGYIYCVLPLSGLLLCLYATIACLSEFSNISAAKDSPLNVNVETK